MILARIGKSLAIRRYSSLLHQRLQFSNMVPPLEVDLYKKDRRSNKKGSTSNSASLQILGFNHLYYRPVLLVNTEGRSYLFNCCEGLQRDCFENGVKLTNLENLFVTEKKWTNVSGSYGMALTLREIGAQSFTIHSTSAISDFFTASKPFLNTNTEMNNSANDITRGEFKDSSFHVRCIALNINPVSEISNEQCYKQRPQKKLKKETTLLAYHCFLPDLPGPLDPQKCRELNVPIGPKLAILKSGQDVILDDGTLIKSKDVCGPKQTGPNFLIIDCPDEHRIDSITSNHELIKIRRQRQSNNENQLDIVIHFSPKGVIDDYRYKQWMDEFPDECRHILLHGPKPKLNLLDSYRLQYLLRQLDENIFPELFLSDELVKYVKLEDRELMKVSDGFSHDSRNDGTVLNRNWIQEKDKIIVASAYDKFNLRPNKTVEFADFKLAIKARIIEHENDPDYHKVLNRYKEITKNLSPPEAYEPEVVFLGTGSAVPSKLRNTSGILVNLWEPKRASVILDCGEDTYGQLVRHYGPMGAEEVLKNLKLIYISHHHTDHHVGLINLLIHRRKANHNDPVILLLPPYIEQLIDYYNENFEDLSDSYSVIPLNDLKTSPTDLTRDVTLSDSLKKNLYQSLGGLLNEIEVVRVDHCANSSAVVMKFNIGRIEMSSFKLAYSGDARPSIKFALVGKDCDLLIHEATFGIMEHDDALRKKHSTTVEAIKVSKDMRAKFTILTHFSQRYSKTPHITEEFDDTIGIAFDHLSVRCPSDLVRLPLMTDFLKVVFRKDIHERLIKYDRQELRKRIIDGAKRCP